MVSLDRLGSEWFGPTPQAIRPHSPAGAKTGGSRSKLQGVPQPLASLKRLLQEGGCLCLACRGEALGSPGTGGGARLKIQ